MKKWFCISVGRFKTWMIFEEDQRAEIPADDRRTYPRHIADDVRDEKTANLIAAAPDLKAVALAYEQWEADVILDSKCWRFETPHITQALWDRFCEIQMMRNAALAKARGEATGLDSIPVPECPLHFQIVTGPAEHEEMRVTADVITIAGEPATDADVVAFLKRLAVEVT